MDTIGKVSRLLNLKSKLKFVCILILILVGALWELLGVSILLPLINLILGDFSVPENILLSVEKIIHTTKEEDILLFFILSVIVIYVLKNLYLSWMYARFDKFANDIKRELSLRLMTAYLKQEYSFFLQHDSSDLIRSINSDIVNVYQVISNILLVISNGMMSLLIIVYLAITNFWMTIVVAVTLIFGAGIIILGIQKRTRKYGRDNQQLLSNLLGCLREIFDGIKEIKVFNCESFFLRKYEYLFEKSTDTTHKFYLVNNLPKYLIESFVMVGILLYLAVNIKFNPNYQELLPQLAVFAAASIRLLPSVNAIYAYFNTIVYHWSSVNVVYEDIMNVENSIKNRQNINECSLELTRDLCLRDISFSYNENKNILKDVNLNIKKGQSIAFIGQSGGGKTTLVDIILGLLSPVKGEVLVNHINISCDVSKWRSKIGYIPQNIFLINGTIRANIAFGIEENQINDDLVWKAVEQAQLKNFVMDLPDNIYTEIGEKGNRLSGGQRQRLGIARALYHDPELLVLDEATSALDTETEADLMDVINHFHGDKTIIIIAHRLSTTRQCDKIYKVEKGHVHENKGNLL